VVAAWESLHNDNFPAFNEQDAVLAAKLRDICSNADRQVTFVATTAGFGNQLYGALSSVLYGAVTGRRILLNWSRFVDLEPFLQPYPEGCDWFKGAQHASGELYERVDDCAEQKTFDEFQWHQDPHPHVIKLIVHSNCLFLPRILQNKIHAAALAKLGIDKPERAFGQLFRAFVQPTANFASKLRTVLLRKFAGSYVVGVQLRVGMMHTEFETHEADDARWKDSSKAISPPFNPQLAPIQPPSNRLLQGVRSGGTPPRETTVGELSRSRTDSHGRAEQRQGLPRYG